MIEVEKECMAPGTPPPCRKSREEPQTPGQLALIPAPGVTGLEAGVPGKYNPRLLFSSLLSSFLRGLEKQWPPRPL